MSTPEQSLTPRGGEVQGVTEQQRKTIHDVFQNPLEIPQVFKGWLEAYLETLFQRLDLATAAAARAATIKSGDVIFTAGAVRTGFVVCDGTSYLRTDSRYASLFAAIGTAFGAVDGTHFNVPDIQGRTVVAKGTHVDVDTLGKNEGQATVASRRPKHRTTLTDTGHNHQVNVGTTADGAATGSMIRQGGEFSSGATATNAVNVPNTTGITAGSGVANDPLDTPSFVVLNAMIKL